MGADSNPVLVVEDHLLTREVLCRLIRREGLKCEAVGTVAEAIARLAMRPACIVLDLLLPDGTGLEIMCAVRRMNLPAAIIISTAASEPGLLDAVRALEPAAMLQKPYCAAGLLALVSEAMAEAAAGPRFTGAALPARSARATAPPAFHASRPVSGTQPQA